MSKPDPAGGSLENILASIRKSLSEQSTDALSETAAAPSDQDKDARLPRKHGLTQRLAGTTAEATPHDGQRAGDDLSDLLEEPSVPAPPAPKTAPASDVTSPVAAPAAASGDTDPLWFLTRRDESAPEAEAPRAAAAQPQNAGATPPSAEPKLTRPEVLRASMPPFFGSSAEAAKSTSSPVEAPAPPAIAPQLARPEAPTTVARNAQATADEAIVREVALLAAAAEAAAARPPQTAPQPVLNGKDPAVPGPAADAILAGDTPHTRALEVMVLDLLKPMLRQWLDENMPRMVAEALSEDVQRTRAAKGDAKKT